MKKVIKCGQLFDSNTGKVLQDQAVVIDGNKIIEVVPAASVDCAGAEIIDLSGKFVMPGLIDAHVHINMNGEPSVSYAVKSDAATALDSMIYAQRDLLAGFTTLRDEGAQGYSDVAVRNAINAGKFFGPRISCSGEAIGGTGGHADSNFLPAVTGKHAFGQIIDSPDEGRKAARTAFKYGADQIKIMATGGVMSFGDEPGAPELTYEEMKAIIDVAASKGKITSAHAHGAEGIKIAIRAGITSIEHGMLMDDECIDMMAEHGTYLIPTIIAAYRIVKYGAESGIPAWAVEKAKICLDNDYESLRKCIAKGVKIGFGTDTGTPYNKHGEQGFEFSLMKEVGFTTEYILQAATRINAEMMKMDHQIGSIEAGKLADIVAFDVSPFEDISVMERCSFVMKDGTVYKA